MAANDILNLLAYDPLLVGTLSATWWLVYPLARLAWFFCYLDARVRKEGWDVTDEPPVPSRSEGLPFEATLVPQRELEATYHLYPQRRGANQFRNVYFRYHSPLGLWSRNVKRPLVDDVRIYPDIKNIRRFDLLAKRNRLSEMGLKLWRLRGKEGEFERLREYRREDEMRHIDWRATAKYQKLISREYTTERNQNIVILLDCGRSMLNETDGISHLDRGLNAAIILSYIALGQGDNVSLVAFSNRIERYVGPVRGKAAIQSLIQKTYDLEPRHEASDYGLACEDLLRRQKKRALVLLITYALDDQHLDAIGRYLRTLISSVLVRSRQGPPAGRSRRARAADGCRSVSGGRGGRDAPRPGAEALQCARRGHPRNRSRPERARRRSHQPVPGRQGAPPVIDALNH